MPRPAPQFDRFLPATPAAPQNAEVAEQRHGNACEFRPLRGLHLLAVPVGGAHSLDAGVLDVGQVGGHEDADDGERRADATQRIPPLDVHRAAASAPSRASAKKEPVSAVTVEGASSPPVGPRRNDGVEFRTLRVASRSASSMSRATPSPCAALLTRAASAPAARRTRETTSSVTHPAFSVP